MMHRTGWTTALLLISTPLSVSAQTRPLLTEEAWTAPAGTLAIETGLDFTGAEPSFLTDLPRDRWAGPLIRCVYSPADSVEFDLEWVALLWAVNDADFGNATDAGDVSLRAKVSLLRPPAGRSALALRFAITLPQTSAERGLGPNTLRASTDLLWTRRVASWTFLANAGLALQDQVGCPPAQSDFLAYGLGVTKVVSQRLTLVAEMAGLLGKGSPGTDARSVLGLGVRFSSSRLRWDAAVRRGLAHASGTWGATVGVTWVGRVRKTEVRALEGADSVRR